MGAFTLFFFPLFSFFFFLEGAMLIGPITKKKQIWNIGHSQTEAPL
jgi:hypothetical protein